MLARMYDARSTCVSMHNDPCLAAVAFSVHPKESYAMRTFNYGGNSHLTRDDAATQSRIALNLAAGGGVRMTSGAAIGVVQAPSGVSRAQPTQSTDRVFQGRHRVDAAERLINVAEALLFSMKNVSPHKNRITQ